MSMLYLNWQVKKNMERVLEEEPYLDDAFSNNSALDDDMLEAHRLSETTRGSGVHYTKDLVCFSRSVSFSRPNEREDINSSLKHPEMVGSDADGTAEFA